MEKLDLKAELKWLYGPSAKEVVLVDVPAMNFLMVDGEGDPNTSKKYAEAVEALYAAAYTLKFKVKKGPLAIDYPVMALEGLWWADDMSSFLAGEKGSWRWTMMIMQPEFITPNLVEEARAELKKKKSLPALELLRLEGFDEGRCAQTMHLGPYSAEGPTIARVHAFIAGAGLALRGKHHEIYMGDPRRTAPEKLRTIIRQPVEGTARS